MLRADWIRGMKRAKLQKPVVHEYEYWVFRDGSLEELQPQDINPEDRTYLYSYPVVYVVYCKELGQDRGNRSGVCCGCKAVGGIAGWIVMDHQGKTSLTAVDCCLNLGDVIQSPNSPGGSCGGIVGEIYNKPLDTAILVRNCISLGSLILRDPAGRAHPITAHADGAIFDNNIYDQRLSVQGDGVPQEQVAQGCTARPASELVAALSELDSRYTTRPDGALTIRNLEIGGGI